MLDVVALKVLIVDDVADTRTNIRRLLDFEEDFEVIGEAGDGEEALKKARELLPDCILMDINMPRLDGIEATRLISMELPALVIVIMSVQGEQEYLEKAVLVGARGYLIKPFGSDELVATLRRACSLAAEGRSRPATPRDSTERGRGTDAVRSGVPRFFQLLL